MTLYHATPTQNLQSIKRRGVLPCLSQCKRDEVWLHTASRTAWAILHTQNRHSIADVIVIEVDIPRAWLTRRRRGLWTCERTIKPERIKRIILLDEIANERPPQWDDYQCVEVYHEAADHFYGLAEVHHG